MIGNIEENYTVYAMSTFGRLSEAAVTVHKKKISRPHQSAGRLRVFLYDILMLAYIGLANIYVV